MNESMVLEAPPSGPVAAPGDRPWPTELHWDGGRPPDPLKAVLAALNLLPSGHPQWFRTKSDPTPLLGSIPRGSVSVDTTQLPDGTWRTVMKRLSS